LSWILIIVMGVHPGMSGFHIPFPVLTDRGDSRLVYCDAASLPCDPWAIQCCEVETNSRRIPVYEINGESAKMDKTQEFSPIVDSHCGQRG